MSGDLQKWVEGSAGYGQPTPSISRKRKASPLLKTAQTMSCRACGAVNARVPQERQAPKDICENCWNSYCFMVRRRQFVKVEFDRWLARQVVLSIDRLKRNGVVGRCEVLSRWPDATKEHQCAQHARYVRNGRRICALHNRFDNHVFVGGNSTDPYGALIDSMVCVAKEDAAFVAALATVLARVRADGRALLSKARGEPLPPTSGAE